MKSDHDRLADLENGINECKRMARACLIIVEHHYECALAFRDTNLTPKALVETLDESMEPLEQCIRQMVTMTSDLHTKYYFDEMSHEDRRCHLRPRADRSIFHAVVPDRRAE